MDVFENHVSFEGIEARATNRANVRVFENHVSFEGIEAVSTMIR